MSQRVSLRLAGLIFFCVVLCAPQGVSDSPSGLWKISYFTEIGDPNERLSAGGWIFISDKSSTLMGVSSLGDRRDGSVIGMAKGSAFDATITFGNRPFIFVRLAGECRGDSLQGRFTADSSDGGFWMGSFAGSKGIAGESYRADSGGQEDPNDYLTRGVGIPPQPTRFVDPEAFWSNQTGKAKRDVFVITYDKNTVLMCRNVPMIWQWWM